MIGVNFQPGMPSASGQGKPRGGTSNGGGVQEAIKVLSLRLPRVVGAQAISPQALLSSPGGGGSRVDSVVNQVLAKYFPTQSPSQPAAQSFGMAPSFDPNQGAQQPTFTPDTQYSNPFSGAQRGATSVSYAAPNPWREIPRIISDQPDTPFGDASKRTPFPSPAPVEDGGQPPGAIAPLPSFGWPSYSGTKEPDRPYEA